MDFEKICMMFTMQEPYYGIILSSMDRKADKRVGTAGVARSGNVFKLYYNPDYVAKLDVDTTLALLKHEVLHTCFGHLTMWNDEKTVSKGIHELRNIAMDLEVNCYLDRSKIQKDQKWYFPEDLGFEKKLGTREYYRLLKDMAEQQQQQQAQNPQQPCNGGQGGAQVTVSTQGQTNPNQQSQQSQQSQQNQQSGNQSQSQSGTNPASGNGNQPSQTPYNRDKAESELAGQFEKIDDHSMWPDDLTQSEMESIASQIDELLAFAAEEVEKNQGTIPGEMVGRIEKIRKKPRPVADWKRYFRRYIGNEFSELIRKSKKRESRRFPDAAGNRHKRKSHILVGIDTSGSVSMPEYREFFGQIKTLMQSCTFHVVECDARIQHEYDFNGKIQETLHGGGGTDFQPVIDMYHANRRKYEGLVYFTDGGADIPRNTPKETLWVISSRGDHDRPRYRVNGASVVIIPSKKQ